MDLEGRSQLHAWVEGRVQGVGFRYFVRQHVAALPISGWVRNLVDGRVELVAEGRQTDLESLLKTLRQGPRGSQVTEVQVEWGMAKGEFQGFSVLPTG